MDMIGKLKRLFGVICFNIFLIEFIFIGTAFPLSIRGTEYVEAGKSETISAVFTQPDGGVSSGTYSGFVSLNVSGVGWSFASFLNDAFYLPYWNSNNLEYYQLSFDTKALVAYNPSRVAKNFIVYDIDMHQEITTAPYVPAYKLDHIYNFVIDTGTSTPANLHFGVSDGAFYDNGGAYTIEISQLQAATVPEPSTLLLCGIGFGVVLLKRKFQK